MSYELLHTTNYLEQLTENSVDYDEVTNFVENVAVRAIVGMRGVKNWQSLMIPLRETVISKYL